RLPHRVSVVPGRHDQLQAGQDARRASSFCIAGRAWELRDRSCQRGDLAQRRSDACLSRRHDRSCVRDGAVVRIAAQPRVSGAARVDGASAWQRFRFITWPGIRAPAALGAILNTLWALREFDIIYVTTGGGPDRATETLAVRIYQEAFAFFRMGTASALGVLT